MTKQGENSQASADSFTGGLGYIWEQENSGAVRSSHIYILY
jgi:hypothetical protein